MGPDLAASVVHNMGVDLTAELVQHIGPEVAAGIVAAAGGDTTGALVRAMGADFVAALVTKLGVSSNVALVAQLGPSLLATLVAAMGPVFIGSLSLSMSSEIFQALFGAVGNAGHVVVDSVTGHGKSEGHGGGAESASSAGWMPGQQGAGVTSGGSDTGLVTDQISEKVYNLQVPAAGGGVTTSGTAAAPGLKATTIAVTPLVGTSTATGSSAGAGAVAGGAPLLGVPAAGAGAGSGMRRQASAGSHRGAGLEGMPPVV
jgi:hypothetical protein